MRYRSVASAPSCCLSSTLFSSHALAPWLRTLALACSLSAAGCGDEREAGAPPPSAADSPLQPAPAGSTPGSLAPDPGSPATGGTEPAPAESEGNEQPGPAAAGSSGAPAAAAAPGAVPATPEPAFPPSPAATLEDPLRILAIGDSITRATCWRALLWQSLQESFAGRFDLVGTLSENNGCAPAGYDRDNQGYSSSLITEIVAGVTSARTCDPACPTLGDVSAAFVQAQPDVVLMHFGTNDVWNGRPTEAIISGYSQVVEAARAANPNVTILVAQIIPMNVTDATCGGCTCAGCAVDVPALNARIMSWASDTTTPSSAVRVVDQFTGFDATGDNRDGVHPNDQGARKMADRWYEALAPLFVR